MFDEVLVNIVLGTEHLLPPFAEELPHRVAKTPQASKHGRAVKQKSYTQLTATLLAACLQPSASVPLESPPFRTRNRRLPRLTPFSKGAIS